jgi:hypothetical protein
VYLRCFIGLAWGILAITADKFEINYWLPCNSISTCLVMEAFFVIQNFWNLKPHTTSYLLRQQKSTFLQNGSQSIEHGVSSKHAICSFKKQCFNKNRSLIKARPQRSLK